MKKKEEEKILSKDIVREIFDRPKAAVEKVSSIFTHFKHPPKAPQPKVETKRPFTLKELPVAVDIGTSSIKMIRLAERQPGGELEITCIDREEYPADKKPSLLDCQREALKRIAGRNRITPEVITNLPAKDVHIYNLTFPQMSEAELGDAIRWKITQLKPFGLDIESVVYGFIRWDSLIGAKSTQQRILVACASKEVAKSRISLLQGAGFRVMGIEAAPICLVNLDRFRRRPSASREDEIVLWLDLGAEESSLVISRGGILYFCRVIALNSKHMTRQIAQHCHITEEEAEVLKKEQGLSFWSPDRKVSVFLEPGESPQKPKDKSSMVYYSLISSLENLVIDIQHSFKYFSYQITQSQITKFDRVILSGGGGNLKNLERFLNARLGVPVERCDPFSYFGVSDSVREHKKGLLVSAVTEFAACAGLAAAHKIEEARRISLMPKEKKVGPPLFKEHLHERPVQVAALILVLAVVLIGLQAGRIGSYGWKMRAVAKEVKSAQARLGRLQSQQLELAKEETALLDKKVKLEERLSLLKGATRKPMEFSKILAEIANLLPEEIWVTKLSYSERKTNIVGSSSDTNLVMQLLEALKSSDSFTEVTFNYTEREPARDLDYYNFEIIAELRQ